MAALTLIPEEKNCLSSIKSQINVKLPCALNKRKTLHPLLSKTSISITSNRPKYVNVSNDKAIPKRLLSAKEHRLKQIQNQLTDAHFHLNELTNENRLLRTLQKRMDSALHRYENSSGEIPNILHKHNEEIRSWQVRYKQLKIQMKDTAQKLKIKDIEFQQLKDEHKHLTILSKDINLGEREKLQNQVIDLSEKLSKQNESINLLQRKLNLETKSYKHQLHVEIVKHKETQLRLNESISNNERLTALLEKKDKIIASNSTRRSSKINFGKRINHNFNFGNSKSLINLSIPIKEYSSEESIEFSPKQDDSSGSTTFVINEKLVEREMFQKNDTISQGSNISTTEDSVKSNDVKDRVDTLKNEFRSKIGVFKHKDAKKNVLNNNYDKIDSSPDDLSVNYSSVDNSPNFDFNDMNKTISELEKETAKERELVEGLIDDFCDEIIESAETATKIESKIKPKEESEVNNNTKAANKKTSSELDEEKKKKLLATLKAIDRGDDDGLKIESLRKSKIRSKILHK